MIELENLTMCISCGCENHDIAFNATIDMSRIQSGDFKVLDRQHPKKKNRPLPSGKITKTQAIVAAAIIFCISIILSFWLHPLLRQLDSEYWHKSSGNPYHYWIYTNKRLRDFIREELADFTEIERLHIDRAKLIKFLDRWHNNPGNINHVNLI